MPDLVGKRVAIVSYRLGMADGVSVTASQWAAGFRRIGMRVRLVAGDGCPDVFVPGLALEAAKPPSRRSLDEALQDVDVVVADNVCSLPVNQAAGEAVAEYLRGRQAILRHHDLPWERERFASVTTWPPDDPSWRHVTVNEMARLSLADRRSISATTVYHGFDEVPRPEERDAVRARLEVGAGPLVLQPTRAIARKNVDVGLELAESLGGTFWLTGPAEDGFADELARLLRRARIPVRRGLPPGADIAAAYAACDAVVLPSSWEGFGLPLIESALHRKPLAVGDFPVAEELAAFGFRWFRAADPEPLRAWLTDPDLALLDHNEAIASRHFGLDALSTRLELLLSGASVCHHSDTDTDTDAGGHTACDCLTA